MLMAMIYLSAGSNEEIEQKIERRNRKFKKHSLCVIFMI